MSWVQYWTLQTLVNINFLTIRLRFLQSVIMLLFSIRFLWNCTHKFALHHAHFPILATREFQHNSSVFLQQRNFSVAASQLQEIARLRHIGGITGCQKPLDKNAGKIATWRIIAWNCSVFCTPLTYWKLSSACNVNKLSCSWHVQVCVHLSSVKLTSMPVVSVLEGTNLLLWI